ncbi:MAG: LVIVD repeat-containing protein [Haloarculaceae archaeon]
MQRSPSRVTRRGFVAGLGAGGLGVATGRASGHPTPGEPAAPGRSGVRASPDGYGPLGRVTVPGATEAVVDDDGETVYVAATDGFATVDVSDPRAPRLLAERRDLLADRPGGPMDQVYDVTLDGDHLLVVGPANPTDAVHAALLYDVRDPAAPERLAVYETDYPIHNCDLADGVAYLTGNDGDRNDLVLLSAASGEELGRWSVLDAAPGWSDVAPILRVVHDVRVRDGRAALACWDAGTWLLDVSDPAAPAVLATVRGRSPEEVPRGDVRARQLERPGNDHYAAPNDDWSLLGVGVEAWDRAGTAAAGGPGGIELWDVSEPAAPTRVGTVAPPATPDPTLDGVWTTAHNFEIRGDRLYTAWYRGGVRLLDVSDPADPGDRRAWRDRARASFWTAQAAVPGSFFVASSLGASD